jgi:hypothetical protein
LCDGPKRRGPASLDLFNDGQDVRCLPISFSLERGDGKGSGRFQDRTAQFNPASLGRLQCFTGALADHGSLLLRQGSEEMQHERVNVGPQFGDQERHTVWHQTADEVNIAAQTIELGDDHRTFSAARFRESRRKLRAPIKSVGALATFDFNEGCRDLESFSFSEAGESRALALNAQPRPALAAGADSI